MKISVEILKTSWFNFEWKQLGGTKKCTIPFFNHSNFYFSLRTLLKQGYVTVSLDVSYFGLVFVDEINDFFLPSTQIITKKQNWNTLWTHPATINLKENSLKMGPFPFMQHDFCWVHSRQSDSIVHTLILFCHIYLLCAAF
jgi:hypothetical protein